MFHRKQQQSAQGRRGQQMRSELGQTMDHAMRAAGHAAGGFQETVGPRVGPATQRMRTATAARMGSAPGMLAPTRENARAEQKQRRKRARARKRNTRMIGLLAGGIAVGAAGALAMRRRRQKEWEEYEAASALEDSELAEAGLARAPGEAGPAAGGAELSGGGAPERRGSRPESAAPGASDDGQR